MISFGPFTLYDAWNAKIRDNERLEAFNKIQIEREYMHFANERQRMSEG